MSANSSTQHPTFSYQVDPLLNISPLIDLYSNCLTHVVDTDGLFHLSSHESPILLSYKEKILKSSLSYQQSFARIRSPRCLLTIVAYFISWAYNSETLLRYISLTSHSSYNPRAIIPTMNFARIHPQIFVILTNHSSTNFDFDRSIQYRADCFRKLSLFYSLRLNQDFTSFPRIFGALIQRPYNSWEFNCSTFESCRNKMEHTITAFAKFVRAFWRFDGFRSNSRGGHPFERRAQAGMAEALDGFILGQQSQRMAVDVECHLFKKSYPADTITPTELILMGRTDVGKFVTTAGVFTPQSSYHVYFSPFWPTVWLGILLSAGVTMAAIVGIFRMKGTQREEFETGLLSMIADMGIWMFATAIGQYKNSGIPLISGRFCREVMWIVTPVVVSWFIMSAFLVYVYSAIFNSDATRNVHYLTNYTEILQLPSSIDTYFLVNESYVRRFQEHSPIPIKDCTIGTRSTFCDFHKYVPAACIIESAIYGNAHRLFRAIERNPRLEEESSKLRKLAFDSSFLCANTEAITRVLLLSEKPLAFFIGEHEFQNYWKLFVQVMRSNPNIKVANNFYSDSSFLSESFAFEFTSGLHPALQGSATARMKSLLSSGIYGLWEKWHHIKFTDGGLQHAEKELLHENHLDPLSFDNSATSWIFQAQAFAWLVAAGIFIGERIFKVLSPWFNTMRAIIGP